MTFHDPWSEVGQMRSRSDAVPAHRHTCPKAGRGGSVDDGIGAPRYVGTPVARAGERAGRLELLAVDPVADNRDRVDRLSDAHLVGAVVLAVRPAAGEDIEEQPLRVAAGEEPVAQ